MLYKINHFTYDNSNGIISVNDDDVQLTKTQKKLFNYFIQHPKTTISKNILINEVWDTVVTQSSVDRALSTLRSNIEEDSNNPKLLITHFGHGISFEGSIEEIDSISENKKPYITNKSYYSLALVLLLAISSVMLFLKFYASKPDKPVEVLTQTIKQNQKLLILPMTFDEITQENSLQDGMIPLLKSTFNKLDSEGQIIFNQQSSVSNQIAMERHWRIDNDLQIMHANVVKNGEIYNAVLEISNGINTLKKQKISADSLSELVNKQAQFIANYHEGIDNILTQSEETPYLEALSLINSNKLDDAKKIINKILQTDSKNFQARFTLHEIFFKQKQYDFSLAELQTLKATKAYQSMGAEIELGIAAINYQKTQFDDVIESLIKYQADNLDISAIKKSKIKIALGKAYFKKTDSEKALKYLKQALIDVNENFNPLIYAKSYYWQGRITSIESINLKTITIYDKALNYAKISGDTHTQILIMNEMARSLFHRNDWKYGMKMQKDAIALMELNGDKSEVARGLGILISFLTNRGLFEESKAVIARLKEIAQELDSDDLRLVVYHYDVVIGLNEYNYDYCQQQLDEQYLLAQKVNSFNMMLNNTNLQLELQIQRKDPIKFMSVYNERKGLFEKEGLKRFRIFLDLYLARYYKISHQDEKAIEQIGKVSEEATISQDFKFLTEAQCELAGIYMKDNPQRALDILNNLEQYNPNPSPFLELKAVALNLLGNKVEALNILNQAKLAYHDSWNSENQALLEQLQQEVGN